MEPTPNSKSRANSRKRGVADVVMDQDRTRRQSRGRDSTAAPNANSTIKKSKKNSDYLEMLKSRIENTAPAAAVPHANPREQRNLGEVDSDVSSHVPMIMENIETVVTEDNIPQNASPASHNNYDAIVPAVSSSSTAAVPVAPTESNTGNAVNTVMMNSIPVSTHIYNGHRYDPHLDIHSNQVVSSSAANVPSSSSLFFDSSDIQSLRVNPLRKSRGPFSLVGSSDHPLNTAPSHTIYSQSTTLDNFSNGNKLDMTSGAVASDAVIESVPVVVEHNTEFAASANSSPIITNAMHISKRTRIAEIYNLIKMLLIIGPLSFALGCVLLLSQIDDAEFDPHEKQIFWEIYGKSAALYGFLFLLIGAGALQFALVQSETCKPPKEMKSEVDIRIDNVGNQKENERSHCCLDNASVQHDEVVAGPTSAPIGTLRDASLETVPDPNSAGEPTAILIAWPWITVAVTTVKEHKIFSLLSVVLAMFCVPITRKLIAVGNFLYEVRKTLLVGLVVLAVICSVAYAALWTHRKIANKKRIIDILCDEALEVVKGGDNEIGTPIDFVKEEVAERVAKSSRLCRTYRSTTDKASRDGFDIEATDLLARLNSLSDVWVDQLCDKDVSRSIWGDVRARVVQDKRINQFERDYYGERRAVWRRLDCRISPPVKAPVAAAQSNPDNSSIFNRISSAFAVTGLGAPKGSITYGKDK